MLRTPALSQLVKVVSEAQRADTIEIRIERPKQGAESSVVVFPPRKEPAAVARRAEITKLLGLRPDLHEVRIEYGAFSGRNDEIDMKTRSMLEIMLEFAAAVQIPEADVAEGRQRPARSVPSRRPPWSGPPMRVLVADDAPKNAHVAVPYARPLVLDRRHGYQVQNHVRHRHVAVFDRRYRH